jgi:hypothetical protein
MVASYGVLHGNRLPEIFRHEDSGAYGLECCQLGLGLPSGSAVLNFGTGDDYASAF